MKFLLSTTALWLALASLGAARATWADDAVTIKPRLVHIRNSGDREWTSFASPPEGTHLELRFQADRNPGEYALRLRQQDVKQPWRVLLNGKPVGELVRDEADLVTYSARGGRHAR